MFGLLRKKRSAKEAERRPPEESHKVGGRGNEERMGSLVNDLVGEHSASASISVRSIIKAAIGSAEQIVDSMKMRAAEEAQQEAAKVIAEARKEAEKIRGEAPVQGAAAENIISAVGEIAKEEIEAPEQALEEMVVPEEKERAQLQEEAAEQAAEEIAPQDEEPVTLELGAEEEEPEKAAPKEEDTEREKREMWVTQEESQSLYTGEVELIVAVPVEPTMVSKLYSYLQTTSEVKFVRTVGSWNKGSAITIALDKPIPLISVLASKLPEANVVPERTEGSGHVKGARRRINISLKNK